MTNTSKFHLPYSAFRFDLIVVVAIILLAFLLYASNLRHTFVWYDAEDLVHVLKNSPAELLAGMPKYPYYRPLIWLFWKALLNLWADRSAVIMYAYLLGAHILNGVLLFALVRDLTRQRLVASAAALLFITFPFSYQAIMWATAQSHPTNLLLCLVCVVIYVRARLKNKGWPYHLAAAFFLAGATLVAEAAFIDVGAVFLAEGYLTLSRRVPRLSKWPLWYVAVTAIMLVIYASANKYGNAPAAAFNPLTTLYLIQSLFYPVSMLAARLCQVAGCNSIAWLWPLAIVTLVLLVILWRSGKTLLVGLFGLALFAVGAAPVWLRLDYTYYLQYGARVMYHASPGAAIIFAALLGAAVSARQRAVRLLFVALILVQSGLFLLGRQALSSVAFDLLDQENRALLAPHDGQRLFINTIDLFGFRDHEFPLGWFGVLSGPWHNQVGATPNVRPYDADWAIDSKSAQEMQARSSLELTLHDVEMSPAEFQESFKTAHEVYRVEALNNGFHLFKIAEIEHKLPEPSSFIAEWSQAVRLVDASIDGEAGVPILNLEWWIGGPFDPNQTVFVHVRNAAGEIVAQFDAAPIGNLAPLGTWGSGDLIRERRPLLLPSDLPPGHYTVDIGLYNWQSLKRLLPDQTNSLAAQDGVLAAGDFDYPLGSSQAP